MSFKRILIVLLLVLFVFSVGKIYVQFAEAEDVLTDLTKNSQNSIGNIEKWVKEKTPDYLIEPIVALKNRTENFRKNIILKVETRKRDVEYAIGPKVSREDKESLDTQEAKDEKLVKEVPSYYAGFAEVAKAFKYLEVFILIVILFVLSTPLLYYSFFVLATVVVLRFFWYRIY